MARRANEDITKLPQWAQHHIRWLETENKRLERDYANAFGDQTKPSDTFIRHEGWSVNEDGPVYLRDSERVYFKMADETPSGCFTYANVYVQKSEWPEHKGEYELMVNVGESCIIQPEASNCFRVYLSRPIKNKMNLDKEKA